VAADRPPDAQSPRDRVEKVLELAFRGGKLYALEMSTTAGAPTPGTGAIVRVNRHGPPETVVSGLMFPTGMTVGPDGASYVSNQGSASAPGKARSCASRPDQNERPGESSAIQTNCGAGRVKPARRPLTNLRFEPSESQPPRQ